jgi:FADH2 O2-dependent halogenase
MVYFVAAIYCEARERDGRAEPGAAFLLADDEVYREAAAALCRQALKVSSVEQDGFADSVRRALELYNLGGLCDPQRRNMYSFIGGV